MLHSLRFILIISFLLPFNVNALQKNFQNQIQRQSLNNLIQIIEDTQRYQNNRSRDIYNGQLPVVLNRIRSARRLINNLGSRYLLNNAPNATKPFAFITAPFDRKRLVKTLTELEKLHQDLSRAHLSKKRSRARKTQRAINRKGSFISKNRYKWTKIVGNASPANNYQSCHYFKPNSRFFKTWASCCDINNGKKSRWTKKKTGRSNTRFGNCSRWGVKGNKSYSPGHHSTNQAPRSNVRVCRNLRPNDPYFKTWRSCCDLGNNKSKWTNKKTNKSGTWKGTCASWGIR